MSNKKNNVVVSAVVNEFSESPSPEHDTRPKIGLKDNLTNLSFDSCVENGIYDWSPADIPDDLESYRDRMISNSKFIKDRKLRGKYSIQNYSPTIEIFCL